MSRNIIWVTGPAGSGKTLVVNEINKYFSGCKVLTDAKEMLELNKADAAHQHHKHPDGGEGFVLTTPYHFDESVRRICSKLTQLGERQLGVVELARGIGDRADIDLSYRKLITLVSREMFDQSFVLYIKTTWTKRLTRNLERRKVSYATNVERQSFYVPQEAMNAFFKIDDFEETRTHLSCPVYVIENDAGEKEVKHKILGVINRIKANISD